MILQRQKVQKSTRFGNRFLKNIISSKLEQQS